MNLIMAQGAQHTTEKKLAGIIHEINDARYRNFGHMHDMYNEYIRDEYGIGVRTSILPYAVEQKYDGYSYLNVKGRFFSKSLSTAKETKGMPVEKSDHVPHLTKILKHVYEQCGCDLHGELYMEGGISDDVTRIMGCTADKAVDRQNHIKKLNYMLIDIRAYNGRILINEPHHIRRAILKYVYNIWIKPEDPNGYIKLTEEFPNEDPRDVFKRIVLSGGEGIIIKNEHSLYIPGKKPANNWIKGKKKITHDVFMVGLNEGTGKNEKLFGSIRFAHMVDGQVVECGNCSSGLSDEMRENIYNNADHYISTRQVFEIEAIQESVKSFRNAVFKRLRDDKSWDECDVVDVRIKEELI